MVPPTGASRTLTPPHLELRELCCTRDERCLFSGLNARWESGDLVQLLGPNGSGKTSLMRLLAGVSRDYDGEILWCGRPVQQQSWEFASELLYLGHQPGIKKALTPLENLRWYASLSAPSSDAQLIDALAQLGMAAYRETPCAQLSAGQLRRVALARLYISRASLWILDEPFTAIDKLGVARLESRLQARVNQGGLVLITSHQDLSLSGVKTLRLEDFRPRSGVSQ